MVFVRDRGAELCEDAVAGALHIAIIMAGSIDYYFRGWIVYCARLFLDREGTLATGAALHAPSEIAIFGTFHDCLSPFQLDVTAAELLRHVYVHVTE